ncbi:DNA-binding transcriptional activator YeiL [Aliarcobacter thereius]|uniref:Crp/Fnr family transcriptional regulator n=1 Tax=Aliarcobacter thereius TaxID=544718 RepID=A0A1C0B5G6_9BACT|nr:Crp/Fnr family transcriptional regulator [Aliarcobacter thereius]OCL86044.1 DNA-binding transcriptional activator YeiL [Aliarcobacter thereius]OCL97951.1 DNA-binding transcriptional activator YeiL [Aliarcobacter thereius]TLS71091.1 Crp/Fnr family transcriptional regulator [Aliarcobacter thereius]TLT06695.1 Crp/Fnr family transcriptional regulator [Aliarcobacter thereius]
MIEDFYKQLRIACDEYFDFDDESFKKLKDITFFKEIKKGEVLLDNYSKAKYIYFICKGVLRTYYLDENGKTYTKNLFSENYFSASKVSLLTKEDSYLSIEALEDCNLIFIDYDKYKELISKYDEFKIFYINYLEKNWVIVKEKNEISLIIDDASIRYQNLIKNNPNIENRIPLHYISDHLGITATQLSRIRKKLKENL